MSLKVDYIENDKLLIKIALAIFSITFFILFTFEPFGDIRHGFLLSGIVRVFSYALTASLSFFLLERFLKPWFLKLTNPTIYNPVFWYFVEFVLISIFIFICRSLWVGMDKTTVNSFFLVLYRVIVIGALPILFVVILLYSFKKSSEKSKEVTFKSKDKNPEYLKLIQDTVLCLKSDENYTTIYFKEGSTSKSKILRGSLSYFETALELPFLRIHRANIINLNNVKNINVNSQGGIVLLNTDDINLRVSRKYVSDLKKNWEALKCL